VALETIARNMSMEEIGKISNSIGERIKLV
jgi:hypothetical protein